MPIYIHKSTGKRIEVAMGTRMPSTFVREKKATKKSASPVKKRAAVRKKAEVVKPEVKNVDE